MDKIKKNIIEKIRTRFNFKRYKKKYHYFLSYSHATKTDDNKGDGFGSLEYIATKKIKRYEDLQAIAKEIMKTYENMGMTNCVILNYRLF